MDPVAEGEMLGDATMDVESIRVDIDTLVSAGAPVEQEHLGLSRDGDAMNGNRLRRPSTVNRGGRLVTQDLFHRVGQ
jgi:hypothetical protein